jgi:hypothetical protein
MAADTLLALHVTVVVFLVLGQVAVMVGGWRGWGWIRNRWFRYAHLATIAFVVAQAWLGNLCPLTVWEQRLRAAAGQAGHEESFIGYWLGRWLYWDLPWWVFLTAYTAFGLLVLASWRRWPPRRFQPE